MIDFNKREIKVGDTLVDKWGCIGKVYLDVGRNMIWDSVKGGRWMLMQTIIDLFELRMLGEELQEK